MNPDGPGERARREARLGLYVHVPFCAVRCHYCHFSTSPFSAGMVARWFAGMEREAALRAPLAAGERFTSVFFGGGTPSALSSKQFARLWKLVREHFALERGAEITLEANPESVKPSLLEAWAAAGVNRLSLGAQSFEPTELRALGRIHDEHRPAEAIALAREHGFERLSLDLMYGYPGHEIGAFERSLEQAVALGVEHLSAYCFIVDAGTALGDAVLEGRSVLPSDERQAEMYALFLARTARAGMAPYETSNACFPGAEARHNLVYWLRRDYMALGPSAHGLWRGERWGNLFSTAAWADALGSGQDGEVEREVASPERIAEETVMLALRLASGLHLADYSEAVRSLVLARFGAAFAAGEAGGRLERFSGGWRIPPSHRFVADDTIAWLAARAG